MKLLVCGEGDLLVRTCGGWGLEGIGFLGGGLIYVDFNGEVTT